jgi:quercetin dioxygenase-like cupin family protein
MDVGAFEATLKRDGFETEVKSVEAGKVVHGHAHDFDVRALVLEGDISLTVGGTTTQYKPGDVFTMARGCEHIETIGPAGVRFLAGRRHPAKQRV